MYIMNFVNVLLVLHFPGIVISSQFVDNLPAEIQSAQCTITAGEIKASAEATVSKKLEGVCGSNEMQQAFEELERKLLLELQSIKLLLGANLNENLMLDKPKEQVVGQTEEPFIDRTKVLESSSIAPSTIYHQKQNQKYVLESTTVKDEIVLKSLNTRKTKKKSSSDSLVLKNKKGSSRETEIKKLNNTLLSGEEIKLYSYYWKIENFTEKLKQNASHESSPLFNILNKNLRIKAIFKHLNRDFLYLQLEEVSKDIRENYKTISLDTGNIFKHIGLKISFKHKISILDQANPSNDLISQEFMNTDNGFLVPNSALKSNAYSRDNVILVKIIIYL